MNPSNNATNHHRSSKSLHRDVAAIADLDGDGRVKVGTGSELCCCSGGYGVVDTEDMESEAERYGEVVAVLMVATLAGRRGWLGVVLQRRRNYSRFAFTAHVAYEQEEHPCHRQRHEGGKKNCRKTTALILLMAHGSPIICLVFASRCGPHEGIVVSTSTCEQFSSPILLDTSSSPAIRITKG
ncbi:hypothetical protein DKX38_010388 [Salix brachista]|uniref:Uncharacterized protein n=1 Tax=Salix brachista TaxID=2182728 RepID=A0A5N5MDE7_9ROSI|nr:hypothetical protein DKX38_010388 [Salix brachista]